MAANNNPIFTRTPDIQWATLAAANTTADLTSGTNALCFSADATEGGFVREMRIKAAPGANTVATVFRIWINNGGTTGTATNNVLFQELTIPATTASSTAALFDFSVPLNVPLPAGYKIYATIGTYSTGTFHITTVGGKY